jgi:hypothetical protein
MRHGKQNSLNGVTPDGGLFVAAVVVGGGLVRLVCSLLVIGIRTLVGLGAVWPRRSTHTIRRHHPGSIRSAASGVVVCHNRCVVAAAASGCTVRRHSGGVFPNGGDFNAVADVGQEDFDWNFHNVLFISFFFPDESM